MYSQIPFPPGVNYIVMKPAYRRGTWSCNELSCELVCEDTWFVWNNETGVVQAIFHHEPNVHGWSASEAHAKSYLNRASKVDPFELDMVS